MERLVGDRLGDYLSQSIEQDESGVAVKNTILSLSNAAKKIAKFLAKNGLPENQFGTQVGDINSDGDTQKALDLIADENIVTALKNKNVVAYFSEEQESALLLDSEGNLIVCADPLDGSSNIDNNSSVGTIFSILPRKTEDFEAEQLLRDALQSGINQLASGFFVYGPQTSLILTTGKGAAAFLLDKEEFFKMEWEPNLPTKGSQFAINMSNMRFWSKRTRRYIQSCLDGTEGTFAKNYNMRWCGSLVADAWRIFREGGIFLYPEDKRDNYNEGRLRLVYEANPISFLVEQAGGRATDGNTDILNIKPGTLHQRVPLIFGSEEEVNKYESLNK